MDRAEELTELAEGVITGRLDDIKQYIFEFACSGNCIDNQLRNIALLAEARIVNEG